MSSSAQILTLMTWNIAHGRGGFSPYQGLNSEANLRSNLHRIAEVILEKQADIVCLQEVDANSFWNRRLNLLDILREKTGYAYALHGIHNQRGGHRPLAYGNALLSRLPVQHWKCEPFGQASLGEKGFLYTEVNLGRRVLPVINLHLDYLSRAKRIAQVAQVVDFVKARQRETQEAFCPIVCGDFNTHSRRVGDAVSELFAHLLSQGAYQLYPQGGRTFPAFFPSRALDFIFLPEPLMSVDCEIARENVSDHRAVVLRFICP